MPKELGGAEEAYGIDGIKKPGNAFGLGGADDGEEGLEESSTKGSENEITDHSEKGEVSGPKDYKDLD